MTQDKIFDRLNPEQEKAVRCIEGPVLVFAGAGTGKTRVITHRIAHMIDRGLNPCCIAAMTFTNKAANEMRERLFSLVRPGDAKRVFIGTFHSYCARLLRKEIGLLGWTADFTIADESDQISILKQAVAELGFKDEIQPNGCLRVISSCKSQMKEPADLRAEAQHQDMRNIADVFEKYNALLFVQNMLDFDDLLLLAVRIFEKSPDILQACRRRHTHLLVDEYQDTNFLQFRLIRMLAGDSMNLCVVGDDDQSIYGWRGAEVRNILDFPQFFSGTRSFKLEQNYRSTKAILDAANAVIARNDDRHAKNLWSDCGEGERIVETGADDEYAEASYVAETIESLKATSSRLSFDDIAILYRSNYQSRTLEESLREMQIPYRIVGARSFYERREVRDAIAYLRLIVNPRDDQSFSRIVASPPRGLGSKALDTLRLEKSRTGKSFSEAISDPAIAAEFGQKGAKAALEMGKVLSKWRGEFASGGNLAWKSENFLKEIGYLDGLLHMYKDREEALKRQENVFELVNAMAAFEKNPGVESPTLSAFLEKYALYDDNDKVEEDAEKRPSVTLMTVHAAKGLEFEVVFIVGMENGIFPHERSLEERGLDEERRLFYVAITRAKSRLFISHVSFRMKHGQTSLQKPSCFLGDIPENLVEQRDYSRRTPFRMRGRGEARFGSGPRKFKRADSYVPFDD